MHLAIRDLHIGFPGSSGQNWATRGISLDIERGQTLGLVGESGSGKSVTALAAMRLLPWEAQCSGQILFAQQGQAPVDVLKIPDRSMRQLRGQGIAMIFQEPMSALNPVMPCGRQIVEAILLRRTMAKAEARRQVFELFEQVKLPDPNRIFRSYPHELSGGQKQRVLIAMALSGQPELLVADEPTTALDVTVQKAILDLLIELREQRNLSMLFISHDLGVIAKIADQVAVMRQGEIVESGPVGQVLRQPQHPYTKGLLACRPSLQRKMHRLPTIDDFFKNPAFEARVLSAKSVQTEQDALYQGSPLLEVRQLNVWYPGKKLGLFARPDPVRAVDNVSFELYPGEVFGVAGESGCGKSSLGRAVSRLQAVQAGSVWFRQLNLEELPPEEFHFVRREIQMVFQDPYASLNPRMPVGEAILEPMQAYDLYASDRQRLEKTIALLERVGLTAEHARRLPREFSGGQRQRICLARALALQPKLLVCDEIVSALDVSIQATILNLLLDLKAEFGLSLLFISHDLSVIRQMCDRVMVMQNGRVEALGHPETLFDRPEHPYVRALVEAVPQV